MKKKNLLLTFLIAATFLIGGGGVNAQTTIQIGNGETGSSYIPFNLLQKWCYAEFIYSSTDINQSEDKDIISIAFYYIGNHNGESFTFDLYMKNDLKSSYSSSTDYAHMSSTDKYFSGTLTLPNSAGWVTITLDNTFAYDHTKNLIVAINRTNNTQGSSGYSTLPGFNTTTNSTTNYSIHYPYGSAVCDPATISSSGALLKSYPNINITFDDGDSCISPSDLTAEATSSSTASVSWAAGSDEEEWTLEYSTDADFSVPANITTIDDITTTTIELTGLTPNTTYYVRVKANCSDSEESSWTDPVNFKTLYLQSLPIVYGFEDGGTALNNWTMRDTHANTGVFDSDTYGESSYCFRFYSSFQGITQYLITPELSGTSNGIYVQFYRKQTSAGAWIQVGYSTETISTEDFIWSEATPNSATNKNNYVSYELYCPANTKFVAIKNTATTGTHIFIDNISITVPPTANTNGNWNNAATWATGAVPSSNADVVISSNVTIPNGYTATTNNITIDGGSLIIEDGGQLICNNDVNATLQKEITAAVVWGEPGADAWYFIASPVDGYETSNVIITGTSDTDLYSYDEENLMWYNAQVGTHSFTTLNQGQGYLYANAGANLAFIGKMPATSSNIVKDLDYASSDDKYKGFNLMGNPFTCNLTGDNVKIQDGETLTPLSTYYIVENGTEITEMNIASNPIKPGRGFLIQATAAGQKLVFNPGAKRGETTNKPSFIVIEAGNDSFMDRACVQIGSGNTLRKMTINDNVSHVYVMQDDKDYAAATIEEALGEMPVCFKAAQDGQYTITVNPQEVEMGYLHLIDNVAGKDINLLATPSYTFNAKADDYESRFRLVFSANMVNTDLDDDFAFFSNGQLVIANEGESLLQVIDVNGRIVMTESVNGTCSKAINVKAGVYVLRLIQGTDVKTQKIIVK